MSLHIYSFAPSPSPPFSLHPMYLHTTEWIFRNKFQQGEPRERGEERIGGPGKRGRRSLFKVLVGGGRQRGGISERGFT